jgi:ribose transport system ATP-binding protein
MTGINKLFSHVYALRGVDFDIRKGEVHALLGENGAGKSTLIKILTGVYPKDGGTIEFDGKPVQIESRDDAARLGIACIYQELSLVPTLTVTQNILLNKEKTRFGVLRKREMREQVAELIRRFDFPLTPDSVIETLSVAQRQMAEILKALSTNATLIVMDEPTASLSSKESEMLFRIIHTLRDKGVSILYISHRLEEVFSLSDRITVLRDGKKVGTVERADVVPDRIVRMMIGKELSEATASRELRESGADTVLELKGLSRTGYFEDVSLRLHKGEVLVITGLVGSGRTEVLRAIFGSDAYDRGEILYRGEKLPSSTDKTIRRGFGLIPEDRRTQGFAPILSVERNVAVTNQDKTSRFGVVDRKKEKALGIAAVKLVDLRPPNPQIPVGNLSGGNQQKVVLGKWLTRDLNVLLVDEPTVGIDVGAKDEIYNFIEGLANKDVAVLMVSSDIAEVLRVAHRILVMRGGRVIREFSRGVVTQEDILLTASGIQAAKEGAEHEGE